MTTVQIIVSIRTSVIPYSGKFTKDFIFENFENIQAFSKIFFEIPT